jgi:hypothetical protein
MAETRKNIYSSSSSSSRERQERPKGYRSVEMGKIKRTFIANLVRQDPVFSRD